MQQSQGPRRKLSSPGSKSKSMPEVFVLLDLGVMVVVIIITIMNRTIIAI